MSKGSAPRKQRDDKAYADNWDKIFGVKKEELPEGWGRLPNMADLETEQAKNILWGELLDAMPVKTWTQIRPLIGGNCGECDHASDIMACKNPEIRSFMQNNTQVDFLVASDFGCNKWERKV